MRAIALLLVASALAGCASPLGLLRAPGPEWPATSPPASDPEVPGAWRPVLDAAGPVLDALPWSTFAEATDPAGLGLAFLEFGNRSVREFALAASSAHTPDSRNGPLHAYGHPEFNPRAARIPVEFANAEGDPLVGEVSLPFNASRAPEGLYPAVVFFQGVKSNHPMYRWWHTLLADAGFVVLAFDFTGQGASGGASDVKTTLDRVVADAMRSIDYLLQESPVRAFVDAERIGTIGHSMGGMAALSHQSVDPRVKAVVAAPPGLSWEFGRARIPIQLQTGDYDGPIAPVPLGTPLLMQRIYDRLEGDRELIVTASATHGQHTSYPLIPTPTWSREVDGRYSLAWMRYHLQGDASARDLLVSPHPRLSALAASLYRLGNESGRLAGAVPPAAAPDVEGTLHVVGGGGDVWDVRYRLDRGAREARLEALAIPGGPRATAISLTLEASAAEGVHLRLAAGGTALAATLVPPSGDSASDLIPSPNRWASPSG